MHNNINKKTMNRKVIINIVLFLIVILISVAPLYILRDAEFEGADGIAEEAVMGIKADYEPWFSPIFEPKSSEIESLLFAVQAAAGAGIIGYCLGYLKGRKKKEDEQGI